MHIYLDGQMKAEIAGSAEPGCPGDVRQLFLGGRNGTMFPLEGKLDEVTVFDRVLTSAEIAAHFSSWAMSGSVHHAVTRPVGQAGRSTASSGERHRWRGAKAHPRSGSALVFLRFESTILWCAGHRRPVSRKVTVPLASLSHPRSWRRPTDLG